jgi:hypothetical protein
MKRSILAGISMLVVAIATFYLVIGEEPPGR